MTRALGLLVVGLLVLQTASYGVEPVVVDDFDAEKLVGKWNYEKGVRAGEDSPEERLAGTVTISKDEFRIPGGPDLVFVMGYELDKDKSPVTIDITIKEGPVVDAKAMGIIKIDGGKITLCYDPNGQTRPEKFESTEDNGFFLFVLKPEED